MLSITEGNVFIKKSGVGEWTKAESGTSLKANDIIKADDKSRVVISFFEGTIIELEPGTQIEVTRLDLARDSGSTTIKLRQQVGRTISRVTKLTDSASRYEIETPAGVAAVRGTTMFVIVSQDGTTAVGNADGAVFVSAQGVEVEIPEGMHCVIVPGFPPSQPRPGVTPQASPPPPFGGLRCYW